MSEAGSRAALDAAVALATRVFSAGLTLGLQILLARMMELQSYGNYITLWTWLIALGSFGAAGFAESSLRFLPRYRARSQDAKLHDYWRFGLAVVVAASCAMACIVLFLALTVGTETPAWLIAAYVALGLPFLAVEYYLEGISRSFGWFRLTSVPVYIVRPLLIAAVCAALAAAGVELTLAVVGGVVIGAMAAISIALAVMIARRLGRPQAPVLRSARLRRLWMRASLPLLLVSGMEDLLTSSDLLLLGLLMAPEDVALYFAAARTLALVNFASYAIHLVSGRDLADANIAPDRNALQAAVLRSAQLTFWFTCAALAVTLGVGPLVLGLFGEAFVDGYVVMLVLAAGLLAGAVSGQAGQLLIVVGRQRESLAVGSGTLLVNGLLSLALIPLLGTLGAALGTSLAMAGRSLALILVVRRRMGLKTVSLALPSLSGWPRRHSGKPRLPARSPGR